jgi:hypothetical protein
MDENHALICKLDEEASRHGVTWLVLGFDSGPAMAVRSDHPDRLRLIDEAVGMGGIPVGLIVLDNDSAAKKSLWTTGPFLEYPDQEEAQHILRGLADRIIEKAEKAQT